MPIEPTGTSNIIGREENTRYLGGRGEGETCRMHFESSPCVGGALFFPSYKFSRPTFLECPKFGLPTFLKLLFRRAGLFSVNENNPAPVVRGLLNVFLPIFGRIRPFLPIP
jgi:hypothetical protein